MYTVYIPARFSSLGKWCAMWSFRSLDSAKELATRLSQEQHTTALIRKGRTIIEKITP